MIADSSSTQRVTALLRAVAAGADGAAERLYEALYPDLRRLARAQLLGSGTMSLDAPALVHEAFLRFRGRRGIALAERAIFFAYVAKIMRSVVVDHVRERSAAKRGGGERLLTLTTGVADEVLTEDTIGAVHEALAALERVDERAHRVVEMRYFGGFGEDEIAAALGVSVPTVKRDWRSARAFLYDYIRGAR